MSRGVFLYNCYRNLYSKKYNFPIGLYIFAIVTVVLLCRNADVYMVLRHFFFVKTPMYNLNQINYEKRFISNYW